MSEKRVKRPSLEEENRALNEQVKLLVQTEQRLYRSQAAAERQVEQTRLLADFALHSSSLSSHSEVIEAALKLLAKVFDALCVQTVILRGENGSSALEIITGRPAHEHAFAQDDAEKIRLYLESLERAHVVQGELSDAELRMVQGMYSPELQASADILCVIPMRAPGKTIFGYIAMADCSTRRGDFFRKKISIEDKPYMALLGGHIDRALQDGLVLARLQQRSRKLSENNRKLQTSIDQLGKMDALGQLAGGVAHDFNNLLTIIVGSSEFLRDQFDKGSDQWKELGEIFDAGQRAAKLTSQLLTFSRKQERRLDVFAPLEQVQETVGLLRRLIGANFELEIEGDTDAHVRADRGQLQQVIMNLVVNARDACAGKGNIVLRVQALERGPDSYQYEGPCVVLEVSDDGCGMSEDTQTRMFEPFFTTKDPGQGTGMGLALVFGIVSQSEGHIDVRSQVGEGTSVRVYLPEVAAPERQATTTEAALEAQHAAPATILLVDDEPGIIRIAKKTLEAAGHAVLTASNGREALAMISENSQNIDLVVTDIVMPELGGVELADVVHRDLPNSGLLFVSGYQGDTLRAHGLHEGKHPYLTKPFAPADLLAAVSSLLNSLRSEQSSRT